MDENDLSVKKKIHMYSEFEFPIKILPRDAGEPPPEADASSFLFQNFCAFCFRRCILESDLFEQYKKQDKKRA